MTTAQRTNARATSDHCRWRLGARRSMGAPCRLLERDRGRRLIISSLSTYRPAASTLESKPTVTVNGDREVIGFCFTPQDGNSLAQVKARRPFITLVWWLYKRVYLKADAIKAISHFIKDLAREVGYHGKIEVIPNGVDIARFSASMPEDELAELKQRLGKKMGDVFLFTASRLVLSRGVEDVIRALSHLPSNIKLLVAGDGEDRGKLETIARKSGVSGRVIFAGQVPHSDVPNYLKISDIFVRPSIIEGMGSAFVEAFAAGIPVVATPVGGIPDFLCDPDRDADMEPTGLFCNVRDPESIARAVKKYMDNPTLTARIVKNARALAREKYDWGLIAEQMKTRVFTPLLEQGITR